MKKIFKSKKTRKINLKKIVLMILISFFSSFLLSKISFFKSDEFINLLRDISINKIYGKDVKLNGKYLINVALTSFDDIKFTKEVFKQSDKVTNNITPRIYIYNT